MTVSTLPPALNAIPSAAPDPLSPLWWTRRLFLELQNRQSRIERLHRYAIGRHDDPTVEERASRAFRRIMRLSKSNVTGLVVQAAAARAEVQGFRFGGNADDDADAWRIWQTSDFDAGAELVITAALRAGRSFVLVEPPRRPDDLPRLYPEDARQVVVAYAPGSRTERLAALKAWVDEWTGELHATLYLPTELHRFRAVGRDTTLAPADTTWAPRQSMTEDAVVPNPLGTVPVFELRNRPDILGGVLAEHEDVCDLQDAANHIALNALIAAEYGAFRQKWVTGLEVPKDEAGAPIAPFDVAVNRLLVSEGADTRFGDFNATDLRPYIDMYEAQVKNIAAVSQTPASYLLGGLVNLSAEALAAAESGLVTKVKSRRKHYEQAFEGAMRLCFSAMGDPRAGAVTAETVWAPAEIKSDAQQADAAVKLTGGAPVMAVETAQERFLGMSAVERERDAAARRENDTLNAFGQLLNEQAAPLDTGGVPAD